MPIVSRLSANGKFMTGDLVIDEINTSNNVLRVSGSSVAVEVFDEVSMNPSLASNLYSASESQTGPTTSDVGASGPDILMIGPFGVEISVQKVSSTTALNSFHVLQDFNFTPEKKATFSVFAKANELRYFSLTCDDQGQGGFYSVFDALTGQVVYRGVNTGTNIASTSTYYGNGWWRFSVSGSLPPTNPNVTELSRFSVNLLANSTDISWYDGSVIPIGYGLFLCYYQLETNTFASTLKLGTQTPFANLAMRLETANNSTNTAFIVDRSTTLFVGSEFDEVNTII